MRSGRVRISNANQWEPLQLVTRERIVQTWWQGWSSDPPCMTTAQGQKVKVTRSRDISADKNAVTRQWMVISSSNLVGIINVGVDVCGVVYFIGQ